MRRHAPALLLLLSASVSLTGAVFAPGGGVQPTDVWTVGYRSDGTSRVGRSCP
jgi:hypothetical protein